MKFDKISKLLHGIPYTSLSKGKNLYDVVIKNNLQNILELGFAHGVASCYMAAALDEFNSGKITVVDLEKSKNEKPNIEDLLNISGLSKYVDIFREKNSYNWFLNKEIGKNTDNNNNCIPKYDFVFIDGPKNWTIDGFAFFLVDKLLKKNGWICFDDYLWSYKDFLSLNMNIPNLEINQLSDDQINKPNVKEVFHKLVMQHEFYSNFRIEDNILAFAQKVKSQVKNLNYSSSASFKYKIIDVVKKFIKRKY
jgi:predicted O-methyltransferase YrrM